MVTCSAEPGKAASVFCVRRYNTQLLRYNHSVYMSPYWFFFLTDSARRTVFALYLQDWLSNWHIWKTEKKWEKNYRGVQRREKTSTARGSGKGLMEKAIKVKEWVCLAQWEAHLRNAHCISQELRGMLGTGEKAGKEGLGLGYLYK